MAIRETIREGGYEYVKFLGDGEHVLRNDFTGNLEL